jgi:hypothetical protein
VRKARQANPLSPRTEWGQRIDTSVRRQRLVDRLLLARTVIARNATVCNATVCNAAGAQPGPSHPAVLTIEGYRRTLSNSISASRKAGHF